MAKSISINEAPHSKRSVLQIVNRYQFKWLDHLTCCTQEPDGLLIWWNCTVEKVREAKLATPNTDSLIPVLGNACIGHLDPYKEKRKDAVGYDWKQAIVLESELTPPKTTKKKASKKKG